MYDLVDFTTKKPVSTDSFVFTGKDSPWEVVMDLEQVRSQLNMDYFKSAPPCLAKYLPLMPIKKSANFVSLRETATPLIRSKSLSKRLGIDLYFKVEGKNPTGSFKDRGSAVDISVAQELGAKSIILASTGNMAASCACYAAAAKIPCFILVPEGVAVGKLAQVIAFGGHIVQVKGHYNDAARLAEKIALDMGFYLAGDYAYRVEGQKTAVFELIEQLLFQVPDMIVVPVGCGTNMAAYAKGLKEYQALGLIERMPKLMGVEAEGAAAVVNAFAKGSRKIEALQSANTLASAIAVPNPLDGVKALDAIYSTDGLAVAVSDQEILEAQYWLSTEEGLFVESASAATVAALIKSLAQGEKKIAGRVVCVLSGDGLKDSNVVLKAALKPATIYPDANEFMRLYDSHFFEGKSMVFVDKSKVLFEQAPSKEAIKKALKDLLNAEYSQEYLEKIQVILTRFLQKGKAITVSDFQDSVQDAIETLPQSVKTVFSVLDFSVATGKDRMAEAKVTVQMANEIREAQGEGVGPVDAVIKALAHACREQIDFKLTDYKVEIRGGGVDAVVHVELKLAKGQLQSSGYAASPDIIQASIEAFQEAYNGFA